MRAPTLAVLAALSLALPAYAQDAKPAPKPDAKAAAEAKPKPERAQVARKGRRDGDARHCLGEPSNTAIIKCAEAYL